MVRNNLIHQETSKILKIINADPHASIYCQKYIKWSTLEDPTFPQITVKKNKLFKYIDHYLQPLTKEIKSYTSGTTDFLNKIQTIQDAILVRIDARSLNANIELNEGILA